MRVGIIGIGQMGWALAQTLMQHAYEVAVRDIREEANEIAALAGAEVLDSPASVARACDALVTFVVDGAQTEDVLFGAQGAAQALRHGQLVLMCSTMSPDDAARCASRLADRGVLVLDAPVSGGPDHLRAGQLTMMVAGPQAALDAARPLFDVMARDVFHLSVQPGDGARVKLVNNMLAGTHLVATAEALSFGAQLGLDMAMLFDVIRHSSGQSWIGDDRFKRLLAGDHGVRSSPEILAKDLRLALAMAGHSGFEAPLAQQSSAIFNEVSQRFGERDDAEVVRWYDQRAGTHVVSRLV